MKKSLLVPIFLILTLISCEKDKNENTGKVTFFTNAQIVLDCGEFDVEVYIDNTLEGVIKNPYLTIDGPPDCNSNSSSNKLSIDKPEGVYEFTAKLTCSETLTYIDEFTVKNDSCTLVYIDLTYSE